MRPVRVGRCRFGVAGVLACLMVSCDDDKPVGPVTALDVPAIPGLLVEIVSPADGDTVVIEPEIRGTVSGLPAGHVLRVLVRPPGEVWWSQPGVALLPDSSWTATIFVGQPEDAGTDITFLIGVVAIPTEDDRQAGTQMRVNGQLPAVISVKRR